MLFEMAHLEMAVRYRLLTSTIVPRPIAWITTLDREGRINAAPFSCFNLMGYAPPMVAVGFQPRDDGGHKDSTANILATGELVINLVQSRDAEAMAMTAIAAPPQFDEAAFAGLALAPSHKVAPPRIASAPVSLECRNFQMVQPSAEQTIVLAEVLAMHVDPRFVQDGDQGRVDTAAMDLIGRMQGPGWYTRCSDLMHVPLPLLPA